MTACRPSMAGRPAGIRPVIRACAQQKPSTCFVRTTKARPRRSFQTQPQNPRTTDYAFAFDIDGVLLRSSKALPNARRALQYLQSRGIPFILLTNGGGKKEKERTSQISDILKVPLDESMIVQSHTPLRQLVTSLRDKPVLVVGGDGDQCRIVAEDYGFRKVLIPGDLIHQYPALMPFCSPEGYKPYVRPLERAKLSPRDISEAEKKDEIIKVDAMMVFNDPRDWNLDTQIMLDLLLSHQGYLGSLSSKNGDASLPNRGYQQDGQPPIYFTNPDLFWAAGYHLPRLGQGGFREAFEGVWTAVTGGEKAGAKLNKIMLGKPHKETFSYAENMLLKHRQHLLGDSDEARSLRNVYMIGDNPESDIIGANAYGSPSSPRNISWQSILVRSGVYSGGAPAHEPRATVNDVWDGVQWAVKHAENGLS